VFPLARELPEAAFDVLFGAGFPLVRPLTLDGFLFGHDCLPGFDEDPATLSEHNTTRLAIRRPQSVLSAIRF
jgi:hypothetical protein